MEQKTFRLKSQDRAREMVDSYWSEVRSAPAEGRPVCWSTMNTPNEVLATLGYTVVYPENYGATCGAWKVASKFCDIAEEAGYSPDTCVYARNNLGYAISGRTDICPVGGLPKPDILICLPYCAAVIKWYEDLSRIYDAPLILIEYPFMHDNLTPEQIAKVQSYAVDQVRDAVPLLEKTARRSLDYAKFQECVGTTGEMVTVWKRVLELAQHVPSPVSCFDLFFNVFPMACFRGKAEGLAFVRDLEVELRDRIEKGIAAVPGEKYRLYWGGIPIWYKLGYLRKVFAEQSANLVASSYLYSWSYEGIDASRPFETSLPPQMCIPDNLAVATKSEFLVKMMRDFSVDGMVWQSSRSCKLAALGERDWVERLKREFDIPVMTIEADMCDERSYSETRVASDIASFLEVLRSYPSRRQIA